MIEADEVETIEDLIQYTRDRFGVVVHFMDKNRFKAEWKQFQIDNPHVDIKILVKAVDWAVKARFRITSLMGVFLAVGAAFDRGGLPELDPNFSEKRDAREEVDEALAVERDPYWRTRLYSTGKALERALSDWKSERLPLLTGVEDGSSDPTDG